MIYNMNLQILNFFIKFLVILLPLLLGVAFITLIERKVMGSAHRRYGPNVVGLAGLLQPVFDGVKLLLKESILPETSDKVLFVLAPILTYFLSVISWLVIPFNEFSIFSDINLGILYLFFISTAAVYALLLAGWSSNSKYAILGGLRSTAQMVSYEVSLGIIILSIVFCVGSLNLTNIVLFQRYVWFCIPFFPMFFLFFISAIAETNRAPFDLPEAETELVSGYNIEYSAVGFALFFMGEYGNILLMSSLSVLFFFGGWLPFWSWFSFIPAFIWWGVKLLFFIFLFIWFRVSFPRLRYDQLMFLGWKVFLPFSLCWLIFLASIFFVFDWLPIV